QAAGEHADDGDRPVAKIDGDLPGQLRHALLDSLGGNEDLHGGRGSRRKGSGGKGVFNTKGRREERAVGLLRPAWSTFPRSFPNSCLGTSVAKLCFARRTKTVRATEFRGGAFPNRSLGTRKPINRSSNPAWTARGILR